MPPHLVMNLRARRLAEGGALLEHLRQVARGTCIVHETKSLDELAAAARAIAAARPHTVIVAGGDGALMEGLTALADAYGPADLPRVAIAAAGTASTIARNFGLAGDLRVHFARTVARASDPSSAVIDAPTLRAIDDGGEARVAFIFGAGLVAKFFDMYEAAGAPGLVGAVPIVARVVASATVLGKTARRVLAPSPATIVIDGAPQRAAAYSLIVAATVRNLGLGMRATYRAGDDPERVHVVASALGPRALASQMPLVLLGKRLRGRDHVDALARRTAIDFGSPTPYILDGDLFRARTVTLEPGPRVSLVIA